MFSDASYLSCRMMCDCPVEPSKLLLVSPRIFSKHFTSKFCSSPCLSHFMQCQYSLFLSFHYLQCFFFVLPLFPSFSLPYLFSLFISFPHIFLFFLSPAFLSHFLHHFFFFCPLLSLPFIFQLLPSSSNSSYLGCFPGRSS